jgi:hypothetical protein
MYVFATYKQIIPCFKECLTFQEEAEESKFFELGQHAHHFFHVNQWIRNSSLVKYNSLVLHVRGSQNSKFALAFSTLGDFKNGYDLLRFSTNMVIELKATKKI